PSRGARFRSKSRGRLPSECTYAPGKRKPGGGAPWRPPPGCYRLVTQPEVGDQLAVLLDVGALQVFEKAAAAPDHLQETATAVVILAVLVEMPAKVVDPTREERDLHRSAATVVLVDLMLLDDVFFDDGHGACGLLESLRYK